MIRITYFSRENGCGVDVGVQKKEGGPKPVFLFLLSPGQGCFWMRETLVLYAADKDEFVERLIRNRIVLRFHQEIVVFV